MAAIASTAASRVGWPISDGLVIGRAACSSSVAARPSQNCALLKSALSTVAELRWPAPVDADRHRPAVAEGERGVVTGGAGDAAVGRKQRLEKEFLAERDVLRRE